MTTFNFTFKHSGAHGDLLYSLPIMQHFGGGDLFLHLAQIDWIGSHYYGSPPSQFHQGRMTVEDYESLKPLMLAQKYINNFDIFDPKSHEITHNLDRFRPFFVGHAENYIDTYCTAFGIKDPTIRRQIQITPWLTVPTVANLPEGRDIVVNRTTRWLPPVLGKEWETWKSFGWAERAVFVGLPIEYETFKNATGWNDTIHFPTNDLLDVAQAIAGSKIFIGNQSSALSMAIGLGNPEIHCEVRRDLPPGRSDCYFSDHPGLSYF